MVTRRQAHSKHPNYRTVWATLDRITKRQEEIDLIIKENAKEAAERQKETDLQMKEYNKRFGDWTNRFGEMVEYMVVPNLITKFQELGFVFVKAYQHAKIKDKTNNIFAEVDITLENGDKVMLVEVKTKPTAEDITDHIERMEKVKAHSILRGDKRKFLGAIAGVVFNDKEKTFAMKNGFYVIEPSGETFNISVPDEHKEW